MAKSLAELVVTLVMAALMYARAGFKVVPLHNPDDEGGCTCSKGPECTRVGKHPRIKDWENAASTDEDMIRAWWTKWPDANIGIACGPSKLAVVDVDKAGGGLRAWKLLKSTIGDVGGAAVQITGGGGRHYCFADPAGGFRNSQGKLAVGIDTRGVGGFIVVWPSVHGSGNTYEWKEHRSLIDHRPAPLPPKLVEMLQVAKVATPANVDEDAESGGAPGSYLNGVPKGMRDDELFRYALTLLRMGLAADEAEVLVLEKAARCTPPQPPEEAKAKIKSALKYVKPTNPLDDHGNLITVDGCFVAEYPPKGKDRVIKREGVANWTAKPIERLVDDDGTERVRLQARLASDDKTVEIVLPTTVTSKNEVIGALPGIAWTWLGSDRHVQLLRAYIGRFEVPTQRVTPVMGRHDSHIVLPGGTFNERGEVRPAPIRYHANVKVPFANMISAEWGDDDEFKRARKAILKWLPKINEPRVVIPLLGFIGALPWVMQLRAAVGDWGGFPILLIVGTTGSGKTGSGNIVWRLCGIEEGSEPFAMTRTQFTRLNDYACTNLPPVWIDEYRVSSLSPSALRQFHQELRLIYGGGHDEKGKPNLSVVSYRLSAPVILSGESWPADAALKQRVLVVTPNRQRLLGKQNPYVVAYRKLNRAPLDAFPLRYWSWAAHRVGWEKDAERAFRWARQALGKKANELQQRVIKNMAINRFGLMMLEDFLGKSFGFSESKIVGAVQHQVDRLFPSGAATTPLDDLLRFAASETGQSLKYGVHYVVVSSPSQKDKLVVVRLDSVVTALKRVVQQSQQAIEIFGVETYEEQAKESKGNPDSYVVKRSMAAKFQGKLRRGTAFSVAKLRKALGVDEQAWDPEEGDADPKARY